MNYFSRHWRGELTISKSFWINSSFVLLISIPFAVYEIVFTSGLNLNDLLSESASGNGFKSHPDALLVQAVGDIVVNAVFLWWAVGMWRSCDNPSNNKNGPRHHYGMKAFIILSAAYQIYTLFS